MLTNYTLTRFRQMSHGLSIENNLLFYKANNQPLVMPENILVEMIREVLEYVDESQKIPEVKKHE